MKNSSLQTLEIHCATSQKLSDQQLLQLKGGSGTLTVLDTDMES